tara:strand:- start:1011 stop:1292 length:282 start_codon:yes stop_codon:yes gene_type:complete
MADKRKTNGGVRSNAGRKSKVEELGLIERLSPYDSMVQRKLLELCEEGEIKAITLFYAYRYGRPKETKDITVKNEVPLFDISYDDISEDIEEE